MDIVYRLTEMAPPDEGIVSPPPPKPGGPTPPPPPEPKEN